MPFHGFHASVIGSSHIKNGTECQDYSGHLLLNNACAVVVCDGHGGEKHFRSAVGSALAVSVAQGALQAFVSCAGDSRQIEQLQKSIIQQWHVEVKEHHDNNDFQADELAHLPPKDQSVLDEHPEIAYGSTLIAAVLHEGGCFGVQIGDGECVLLTVGGDLVQPIAEDDSIPFNLTTSLCDREAFQNFHNFWYEGPVAAVMASTDGVRNSFTGEDYFLGFCKSVFVSCRDNPDTAQAELEGFLPQLTAKGSGDDVSVAVGYISQSRATE